MGKPRSANGNGSRTIIARFFRYSDRERVFKCGRSLKDTNFKMFEDIPDELHELWKMQMDKLKKARKEGKRAYFSKSGPVRLKVYTKGSFFSSGKARLFFTFGAWVRVFRVFFFPPSCLVFVPVLSWFGCLVFVISFFAVVFVYGSFGILYSMLINLYMICGSFDMDTPGWIL